MATNNAANFGTGTAGQVLTSNGAGVAPTFQAAATGDVTGPAGATTTAIAIYNGATGKVIQNSVPTIDSNGNILTSASISGATLSIDVVNSSNTANSVGRMSVTVGGSSAGDATFQASVSGGQAYTWGIDNSVTSPQADPFVLAASTSLGTTDAIVVQPGGEITYPLQSAFLATSGTTSDITGDGTTYTMGSAAAMTEVYDQNADFNTNGTYTAPVTGKFQCAGAIALTQIGAAHADCYVTIAASNRSLVGVEANPFTFANTTGSGSFPFAGNVDVDAADTVTWSVTASGSTKTIDANVGTYIAGGILY